MKNYNAGRTTAYVLAFVAASLVMFASVSGLSRARTPTINITVVNNTSGEIRHLFLSPPDSNLWSSDQLNDTAIASGQSSTVGASCDQANVRLIAEDQDGCFIYHVVSCSSDISWTVPKDATRDCGQ
jgi:hypothetical protein